MVLPKILLIGNAKTGKTSFITQHIEGTCETTSEGKLSPYSPTIGVEVYATPEGNVWDCAGDERFGGLRDGYYIKSDFVVLFLSESKERDLHLLINVFRVVGNKPIFLCAGKSDLRGEEEKKMLEEKGIYLLSCEKGSGKKLFEEVRKVSAGEKAKMLLENAFEIRAQM